MTNITDSQQREREILTSIVREMAESMTGAQSTKHWAEDALWFDIPAFASRGIQPALKMFDRVFSGFRRGFQNSRARLAATRNMHAACSNDWMIKPQRS
jgi:ketosteroid isomerase-like protein